MPPRRAARRVSLAVFSLAAALHLYSWFVNPGRPSLSTDATAGWYGGGADQINYAREARALAAGRIPGAFWDYDHGVPRPDRPPAAEVSDYAYGLGYPILGAPFVKLGLRRDPFVIPDMVAFGVIICLAWQVARRFLSEAASLVFAGALAIASPVLPFTVVPWNTTITTIAILAALLISMSSRRDWKLGAAFGVALSLCYAARFTDVLWVLLIVATGMLPTLQKNLKGSLHFAAVAGGMLLATYLAVGWTQKVVFGSFFVNPYHYHMHEGHRGDSFEEFHLSQVPSAFGEVFITATTNGQRVAEPHTSVIRALPWIVAAPIGLLLLLRRRHEYRRVILVAAIASVVASVFYLSYWSGTGADIQNNNMRFFIPWMPLWTLLAAVAVSSFVQRGVDVLARTQANPS